MPRFAIVVQPNSDFNEVLENIKKVSNKITILGSRPNKTNRTSGRMIIECPEELAEKIRIVSGIRYFEPLGSYFPSKSS